MIIPSFSNWKDMGNSFRIIIDFLWKKNRLYTGKLSLVSQSQLPSPCSPNLQWRNLRNINQTEIFDTYLSSRKHPTESL